jgi:4'-phosphopantetheinyl transferase
VPEEHPKKVKAAGRKLYAESSPSIPSFIEAVESPENGVQIWSAQLDSISPGDMIELMATLDSRERARAAQFHFERDRRHFIGARGILRCLLGAGLDIPAPEVAFEYGPHGKPAVVAGTGNERKLHFNISHAGGSAIFALAWNRGLGIDLEAVARLTDRGENLSDLARRILSAHELTIWRELPNDTVRGPALLRAWTRKEAFLKATGEGLFARLQTIEVALDAANPQPSLTLYSSEEGKLGLPRTIHDLTAPTGFFAALGI